MTLYIDDNKQLDCQLIYQRQQAYIQYIHVHESNKVNTWKLNFIRYFR